MAKRKKKAAPVAARGITPFSTSFVAWLTATDPNSVEAFIETNGINNGDEVTVEDSDFLPAGTWKWGGPDLPVGALASEWEVTTDWEEVIEPTAPGWPVTTPPAWPSVVEAPVPPSAPGIPQPVFDSGSATSPAPPIHITGSPIIPPPLIGVGGGPPPNFPPPTPPPIGAVPVGPLVGPAVAAAPVPPSVPGYVQPRYQGAGNSATAPTAASWFPQFTTTFPKPIVVFTNTWMIADFGVMPTLPMTTTTQNVMTGSWGLPGPIGPPYAGGGGWQNPPGAGLAS